jgi:adenylate cyclase
MEYTAIGDVVNVAARLESLARGGQTLVTAEVAAGMSGDFSFSPLGPHPIRGKREPVEIFEVMA